MTDVGVRSLGAAILTRAVLDFQESKENGYFVDTCAIRVWRAEVEAFLRGSFASRIAVGTGMMPEFRDWMEKENIIDERYI